MTAEFDFVALAGAFPWPDPRVRPRHSKLREVVRRPFVGRDIDRSLLLIPVADTHTHTHAHTYIHPYIHT